MSRPTVEKCTNDNIRLVHTGRYGDETRITLTEDEAAALVYDILTKGLPNSGLTHYITGQAQ